MQRDITCFGHADTTVDDREGLVNLVGYKPNEKLWLSIQLTLIGQALKTDFIQSLI